MTQTRDVMHGPCNEDFLGDTLGDAIKALHFQAVAASLLAHFTGQGQDCSNKAMQILIEWVRGQDKSFLTDSGYVSVMEALRQVEADYPPGAPQRVAERGASES